MFDGTIVSGDSVFIGCFASVPLDFFFNSITFVVFFFHLLVFGHWLISSTLSSFNSVFPLFVEHPLLVFFLFLHSFSKYACFSHFCQFSPFRYTCDLVQLNKVFLIFRLFLSCSGSVDTLHKMACYSDFNLLISFSCSVLPIVDVTKLDMSLFCGFMFMNSGFLPEFTSFFQRSCDVSLFSCSAEK